MSRRPAPGRWAAALALSLALGGCSPAAVKWGVDPGEQVDFEDTRSRFTRSTDVYEGTDGRIFVRGTWFAPRFAAALADWQARRAGAEGGAHTAAVQAAVTKARAETWFFVALSTGEFAWNDLGQPDSTLKVRLEADGVWLDPVAIERLSIDAMADRQVVFPYASDLTVGYDIVFPKLTDPKRIRLRVVGIPGRGDLIWDVR